MIDDRNKNSSMLKKIDEKIDKELETPYLIINNIYQTENTSIEGRLLYSFLKTAVRYIYFLDEYHESGKSMYLEEANKHRSNLYSSITPEQCLVLENIEKKIIPYFDYEKQVQKRIEEEYIFNENEIKEYISLRASDSIFYCAVANTFHSSNRITPEITELFHKGLMLSDIMDDIEDYEEDIRNCQPNLLIMYLLNYISKDKLPTSLSHVLNLSCKFKINLKIINISKELYQQAFKSEHLITTPLVKKYFDTKYYMIEELLQ